MTTLRQALLITMSLSLLIGACARRPNIPVVAAPAPTAPAPAAPTPPPPAPAPVAPPAPAPAPAPPPAPAPAPTAAPAPPPPAPKEFQPNDNVKAIYFDFDKSVIRPGDAKILDASAAWLKQNSNQLLLIEGHCDERGTNEYNLALGDRRAKAAMNYLVAQGISADRMTIVSYGEERPVCSEHTEACWAKNRRDQFMVKER
jgi:peptidoglycan-associated lipoprotein